MTLLRDGFRRSRGVIRNLLGETNVMMASRASLSKIDQTLKKVDAGRMPTSSAMTVFSLASYGVTYASRNHRMTNPQIRMIILLFTSPLQACLFWKSKVASVSCGRAHASRSTGLAPWSTPVTCAHIGHLNSVRDDSGRRNKKSIR